MTKITNKVIERYALSYADIECVKVKITFASLMSPIQRIKIIAFNESNLEIEYIQLRSIESITDQEAIHIAKIIGESNYPLACENNPVLAGKTISYWFQKNIGDYENFIGATKWIQLIKFYEGLGVALPTITEQGEVITVEEMVEAGVLKLV